MLCHPCGLPVWTVVGKKDHRKHALGLGVTATYGSAYTGALVTADIGKARQMLLLQEMVRISEG